MLGRGARGYLPAEWLARWTFFAVLLEFSIFSMGLVSSAETAHGDQIYSVGESLNRVRETEVHGIPICFSYPASPEFQLPKKLSMSTSSIPGLNGFQILLRKVFDTLRAVYGIRFGIAEGDAIIRPGSGISRGSGGRRLLLKGFSGTTLSSSRRFACPPVQPHLKERLMMEETATISGEQMQQVALGPPAPKGLVQNEKQDWNQDYAEPDVHPPSSN